MQAIAETLFDAAYLSFVIFIGAYILRKGTTNIHRMVGWMAVLLGCGDAFHLIPRCYALWTTGLEANAAALGIGKLITSVTMTVFYFLLYKVWKENFQVPHCYKRDGVMWGLVVFRIVLCLLPQNQWLSYHQPLLMGILRNIPFAILGGLLVWMFIQQEKRTGKHAFHWMPLVIILSFGFYLPVVLWSSQFPLIGILMIPKTLAYVWVVVMGYQLVKTN